MKRKPLSLKTKLASALLQMVRYDDTECAFVKVISYEASKTMTADQIISRFHFDHGIAHAHDGVDAPWNLTPMPVEDHRIKTAKIDIPRIAKGKRIQRANEESVRRLLAKDRGEPRQVSRWPKRKLQSRSSFERRA